MPHIPQLLTHIQWSFQVPVGGATAQSPIGENNNPLSWTFKHEVVWRSPECVLPLNKVPC